MLGSSSLLKRIKSNECPFWRLELQYVDQMATSDAGSGPSGALLSVYLLLLSLAAVNGSLCLVPKSRSFSTTSFTLITSSCFYSITFSFLCIEVDLIGYWHVNKESKGVIAMDWVSPTSAEIQTDPFVTEQTGQSFTPSFWRAIIFLGDVFIISIFLREQNLCICDRGSGFYL